MSTLNQLDAEAEAAAGGEIAPFAESGVARQQASAAQEVQAAVFLAKRYPRNEDAAFAQIVRSCQRFGFAENVEYSFPRAGQDVSGPSVYLAREMARAWGNLIYGHRVIGESDQAIIGEAFAWDLQTNARVSCEFKVPKLIQRKDKKTKVTTWVKPDERDLRELLNNIAARNYRNCILSLMPSDYVDDAVEAARATVSAGMKADPEKAKKQAIVAFGKLNITPDMIEEYLGHPLGQSSPDELTKLRAIWTSIRDGHSKWADYVKPADDGKLSGSVDAPAAASATATVTASTDPNRGHNAANPAPSEFSQQDSLALDAKIAQEGK